MDAKKKMLVLTKKRKAGGTPTYLSGKYDAYNVKDDEPNT